MVSKWHHWNVNLKSLQNFNILRIQTGCAKYLGGGERKTPRLANAFLSLYHVIQGCELQGRLTDGSAVHQYPRSKSHLSPCSSRGLKFHVSLHPVSIFLPNFQSISNASYQRKLIQQIFDITRKFQHFFPWENAEFSTRNL